MSRNARKFVRVTKVLLAGVTVFCVSWIASVNEWHGGVRWQPRRAGPGLATVRTIVAYSEGKQAELDRPSPVSCNGLPAFPTIPHINRTWNPTSVPQSSWQHVPGTKVSLYAAYYDERLPQRYIRILASIEGTVQLEPRCNDGPCLSPANAPPPLGLKEMTTNYYHCSDYFLLFPDTSSSRDLSTEETLYCQTRLMNPYENSLEVVAAKPLMIWFRKWDRTSPKIRTPLLLSCPLTEPLSGPAIVSVVTEPCNDPTNAFYIKPSQDKEYKRNFTICVKDMNFDRDISQNIVEWIETNKILGVEMIDLYIDYISKETENVLLYYRETGYVRLFHVPIKNKPSRSLWQRRRDHILTYNDCLYRNIKESEFVVPLDIDEIIVPKIAYTWPELIERLKQSHGWNPLQNSAILVRNIFFFDFMQEVNSYKYRTIPRNKRITYVKRDNVRIKEINHKDLNEIELIGSINSSNNEVNSEESRFYEKYKLRCGNEMPTPKLVRHIVRSALVSPVGFYEKALMVTKKVLTAFNHYPMANLGVSKFAGWPAPAFEVQLNHYKESCNSTMGVDCAGYGRRARVDRTALRLRRNLVHALSTSPCTGIKIT